MPRSACSTPARILSSVVLPAPVEPDDHYARTAINHPKVDAAKHLQRAIGLRQAVGSHRDLAAGLRVGEAEAGDLFRSCGVPADLHATCRPASASAGPLAPSSPLLASCLPCAVSALAVLSAFARSRRRRFSSGLGPSDTYPSRRCSDREPACRHRGRQPCSQRRPANRHRD